MTQDRRAASNLEAFLARERRVRRRMELLIAFVVISLATLAYLYVWTVGHVLEGLVHG
jgi:hypothetical protein